MTLSFILFLLALPVIALACEGECIDGVTRAWAGNFTEVISRVFEASNYQLSARLGDPVSFDNPGLGHLHPLLSAFEAEFTPILRHDIFPGYFHGKCLRNGVTPENCPNPDCPVVCGTPGSMVHFYTKLNHITYNTTSYTLGSVIDATSKSYQKVLKDLVSTYSERPRARAVRFARDMELSTRGPSRNADELEKILQVVLEYAQRLLLEQCWGSKGKVDEKHKSPYCSWEKSMKKYILTFP